MEFPASWSIDSEEGQMEKMESGVNGRAIDFAKLGRLMLLDGNWEGKQIISKAWVKECTSLEGIKAWDGVHYKNFGGYTLPMKNIPFRMQPLGTSGSLFLCPQ